MTPRDQRTLNGHSWLLRIFVSEAMALYNCCMNIHQGSDEQSSDDRHATRHILISFDFVALSIGYFRTMGSLE